MSNKCSTLENAEKRPRSDNFSPKDLFTLVQVYEKYHTTLDLSFSFSVKARDRKRAWVKLAADFNKIAEQKRTIIQVKAKLKHSWHEINKYSRRKMDNESSNCELPLALKKLASLRQGYPWLDDQGMDSEIGNLADESTNDKSSSEKSANEKSPTSSSDNYYDQSDLTTWLSNIKQENDGETKKMILKKRNALLSSLEERQMDVWQAKKEYLDLKIKKIRSDAKLREEREALEIEKMEFERQKIDFEKHKMEFEKEKMEFEREKKSGPK